MEDLEEFCHHFIRQANVELGKNVDEISQEALAILKQQNWYGNLRELRNVIRRSVLFTKDNVLRIENLPDFPKELKTNRIVEIVETTADLSKDFSLNRADEKEQIIAALNQTGGNKTLAAKLLKIDRKTLYNKMHLYNIEL